MLVRYHNPNLEDKGFGLRDLFSIDGSSQQMSKIV